MFIDGTCICCDICMFLEGIGPSVIRTRNQLEIVERPSDAGDLECLDLMIFTNRIIIMMIKKTKLVCNLKPDIPDPQTS